MSDETITTEEQQPQTTSRATFDDKGKFVKGKGVRYSKAMQVLIEQHNQLVDELALFDDPAVVDYLLHRADISDKPSAVQNLVAGIRKTLDASLEQSKKNDREAAQAALDALRTQLTEEFDQSLAELRDGHTGVIGAKDATITDLHLQLNMQRRLGTYQNDVHGTINGFVRLLGGPNSPQLGLHPVGQDEFDGRRIKRSFRTADFLFVVATTRPDAFGKLADYVTVSTAKSSELPKLVPTTLEVRTDGDNPGLSDVGRQTLETILRRMTRNWFAEVAPHLTDEELRKTFRDPAAARNFFRDRSKDDTGFSLINLLGLGQGHEHNGEGPGSCPACNAALSVMLDGTDGLDDFDGYVASPFGTSLLFGRGLGNWSGSRSKRHGFGPMDGTANNFDKE